MKCCTAKRCYAVVNFSFVMFWANVYCLWVFFCAINPAKSVRRYNSNMHLHYSAVNSWLTIPTFPQSEIIYAKTKRSAFWASPTGVAQNARENGDAQNAGMPISLWHRRPRRGSSSQDFSRPLPFLVWTNGMLVVSPLGVKIVYSGLYLRVCRTESQIFLH